MKHAARRLGAAAIPFLLASCTPIPPAQPPAAVPPSPPPPVAERPASPPQAFDFALRGPLSQGGVAIGSAPAGAVSLALDGKPVELASDGRFVIGFDRDAAATAVLTARLADGSLLRQTLSIQPRQWRIENLPTLPRGTTPTPEFLARRKIELAKINAAREVRSGSMGWAQHFLWPATGRISGVFGSQRIYAGEPGAYHSGVDVARPAGTPVVSPADGVVILAADAPFSLEGNLLMIDHGMGLNSAFLHLSRIDVKVGQRVTRGQLIGAVGMTGRATGPHLHWSMKWRDARIDPQALAGPMPGAAGIQPSSADSSD
ncbi:M23 family metallopeptidase [Flavisphingomonas formosensis]|uniref:M23 family metallopeptidase n=1 Tax=Flavisphingomonas formosensis TaxID=861534 RepID=UPI0012F740CD|nr:M23 family metallopeptidase [Sphingomonas formosensis]